MTATKYTFYVKEEDTDTRIDTYLNRNIPELNREKIQSLIMAGEVRIGYSKVKEFSERVTKKDKITVNYDPKGNYQRPQKHKKGRKVHVLHEDKDIIVIEKSSGVLSVPTDRREDDTAIHQVNEYIKQKYNKKTSIVFIVHRLDQATSGVLVFAKHKEAQKKLKKLFLDHNIERTYVAIVEGHLKEDKGKIESFLKDSEDAEHKMASTENEGEGKHSVTHYIVRNKLDKYSFVEAKLETGKRNQIRVHFSELGHPIMGDRKYGQSKHTLFDMPRLALHALELGFIHPGTGKRVKFSSRVPQVMRQFIETHAKKTLKNEKN